MNHHRFIPPPRHVPMLEDATWTPYGYCIPLDYFVDGWCAKLSSVSTVVFSFYCLHADKNANSLPPIDHRLWNNLGNGAARALHQLEMHGLLTEVDR